MSTASLSGLLTRVGSLTDADVRELEKLADSYPYCQTAHLLLAKALHDRGSVLAGQKLRRAATGAPDRRALRRLLLTTAPAPIAADATPSVEAAETTAPALAVSAAGELVAHEAPVTEAPEEVATVETADKATGHIGEEQAAVEKKAGVEDSVGDDSAPDLTMEAEAPASPQSSPNSSVLSVPPPVQPAPPTTTTEPTAPILADFDLVPEPHPAGFDLPLFDADDDAPPAGLSLLTTDADEAPPAAPPAPPLAPDPAVAYWLPTSRMGAELTAADFAPTSADGVADHPPAADLTHPWLPDAPPDARWAEHAAAHQPPAPPAAERRPFDYQFALIDRFLRDKPRLRTVDPTRPLPDKLPDLAQKSTRPDEGVVSEAMARILARQGKTARAVQMYEQLQARLPEKAAIFAAQIAALRGPATDK